MADLNLHESMIERGAKALLDDVGGDAPYSEPDCREIAEKVVRAAFEGVPMTNYAIGTLLQFFDLVVAVKDLESRAEAIVARQEGDRPVTDGFETLGHTVTVNWGHKPSRYISGVQVSKLDPPEA